MITSVHRTLRIEVGLTFQYALDFNSNIYITNVFHKMHHNFCIIALNQFLQSGKNICLSVRLWWDVREGPVRSQLPVGLQNRLKASNLKREHWFSFSLLLNFFPQTSLSLSLAGCLSTCACDAWVTSRGWFWAFGTSKATGRSRTRGIETRWADCACHSCSWGASSRARITWK